jgi:hypothetical protein
MQVGSVVIPPHRLRPIESFEAENEGDRECGENEDAGENVDGLNKLKHGSLTRIGFIAYYRCSNLTATLSEVWSILLTR